MSEEHVNAGVKGLLPFCHPEVEWHTDRSVPEPGVYKGIESVETYVTGLFSLLGSNVRFEVGRIVALSGERVFAQATAYSAPRGSEHEIALIDWCFILTVPEGSIAVIQSFLRRDEALEAAGLSE